MRASLESTLAPLLPLGSAAELHERQRALDPDDCVEKFEYPYRALLAGGVAFDAALGNHDEPAQIFYEPFNMRGRRYHTFRQGPVAFFVLDSTYMSPAQLAWIDDALARSTARWALPGGPCTSIRPRPSS